MRVCGAERWFAQATAVLCVAAYCTVVVAQEAPAGDPAGNPAATIGIVLPLSGELGPLGRQLQETAALAAAEHGVPVLFRDSESRPAAAMAAVRELAARPEVAVIVGPLGRRAAETAALAAEQASIPLFALSSVESVNLMGDWIFRVSPTPAEQARYIAEQAIGSMGLKRAAILYPETDYGREAALAFGRRFTELGGVLVGVSDYPKDTTDFTQPLAVVTGKMARVGSRVRVGKRRANGDGYVRLSKRRVDFDTLFVPDFHQRVARVIGFLPRAGIQNGESGEGVAVQLLGLSGWQGKAMELTGGKASGAVYVDLFAPNATGGNTEEFARTFEQKTGRAPSDIEAQTFDVVWLLGRTLKDLAPAKVEPGAKTRAALYSRIPRKKHWTGICGTLSFAPDGRPLWGFSLYRFDVDGAVAPLD